MSIFELFLIAVGLSMDAFAVSVVLGLSVKSSNGYLLPALYFGFFQAIMPLIGYVAGVFFVDRIQFLDHWLVFILLVFIGGKMIKESFSVDVAQKSGNPFVHLNLLVLAIATSIDALAVGVSLAFFEIKLLWTLLLIGVTTFCISVCGVKIGNVFGVKYKAHAEFFGGTILILLGLKILIEHLFFS